MIAAVDAEDPQRRKALAVAAVARADAAEVNWLRPISRLVASLCVPERGPEFLFQAKVLADRMPALLRIIAAVEEGQPDAKYLRHAVDRLRAPNDTTGAAAPQNESVSLDFYRQNAYRGGSTVSLSRGPEALLLFLAVHPGLNKADSLTDALWPELDGDHAFSALKACAHRLRAQSGEPAILVVEDGQWRAGAAIASSYAAWGGKLKELSLQMVAEAGHIGGPERAALRLDFDRLAARERRWSRWAWYASFEQTTAGVFQHLGQLLARDALARQEPAEALEIAQAMSADAPSAEDPVRLIIQSLQMLDRPALAIAAYERFRADARALGLEPTGRLEQLVRSA
jgi:hypothetical protein